MSARESRQPMNREDRQSFALNEAGLKRAGEAWPEAKLLIAKNIETMRTAESCSEKYLARWEQLLAGSYEQLCSAILADTNEGQVLRSINPLSGLLTPEERLKIIRDCYATDPPDIR
jgi:hypothetical protein